MSINTAPTRAGVINWKAPADQPHYGVYYADAGVTPELIKHSTERTFEYVIGVEKHICEQAAKLTYYIMRDGKDELLDAERDSIQRWHCKARRCLTPHRTRAIELIYRRKGDKKPRRSKKVDINYLAGMLRHSFQQIADGDTEYLKSMDHELKTLETFVMHWRMELTNAVEVMKVLARKPKGLQPEDLYSAHPTTAGGTEMLSQCKDYLPKYSGIQLPEWLAWTAERLDREDIGRFANQAGVQGMLTCQQINNLRAALKKAQDELRERAAVKAAKTAALPLFACIL